VGGDYDATGGWRREPDFLVIVLLGLGNTLEAAEPVAFVLPREVTEGLVCDFSNHHPTMPVTRMTLGTIAYLTPYREAWHLVARHLVETRERQH
jgi:hypothetical protein